MTGLPGQKKLGKRPMTDTQLAAYYAKMPKTLDYDSDYDHEPSRTSGQAANATNIPGLHLGPRAWPAATEPRANHGGHVDVAPDDEHARDLLEALNRETSGVLAIHVRVNTSALASSNSHHLTDAELSELYDDDNDPNDPNDPSRLVPDPFLPDACPRITAAERDAIIQDAQAWREKCGMAPLVQDPEDEDLWIQAAGPAQHTDSSLQHAEIHD